MKRIASESLRLIGLIALLLGLYRWIARQMARRAFRHYSRGDYEPIISSCADDMTFRTPGRGALGGTRHSRDGVMQLFDRLYRLFPDHRFEVHKIWVDGPPWNTWIAARWTRHATTQSGEPFRDDGMNAIRLRWGRPVAEQVYPDSQKIEDALARMAEQGVAEAAAPPIEG